MGQKNIPFLRVDLHMCYRCLHCLLIRTDIL